MDQTVDVGHRACKVTGPAVIDARPSLVVLPFDSLSDDKEQAYLADGVTEDLTTALARIPDLFVISRNSAFTYKNKTIQPAQVAKDLGVHYILEGSIRRAGDDMRINAQLIDATTGGHTWAERFDGAWTVCFQASGSGRGQCDVRPQASTCGWSAHGRVSRRH